MFQDTKALAEAERGENNTHALRLAGLVLISASRDKTIKIWDVIGGNCMQTLVRNIPFTCFYYSNLDLWSSVLFSLGLSFGSFLLSLQEGSFGSFFLLSLFFAGRPRQLGASCCCTSHWEAHHLV